MDCLSTGHLIIVMLYLHIRQKHILHENQVLAVRQAEEAEAAHPAAVEEAAVATASNRKWNQLQTQKLLIFIKRQRNLFEFSLSFFSETVYNTFISKCSEELIMNRILIVEDDKDISRELKELLENSGYEAVVLTDFKNACDSIIAAEPDLVLLDINIPYMNGEMLLQQLRSKSDVPVIMVTSRDSEADEVLSMSYGADDYITKPYNPTILLLRINAVFKRIGAKSDNTTDYRGMEILPHKGVIKYKDDEITLTKNEMTIFMYLLSHREHIVSRDELMTELWNNEEYLNDNALTVNISRLRGRFKDIGLEDVIETRKGQGYILV